MSAKDKKIALTITANTRQLRRDMRRGVTEVKGFERSVTGLGTKLRAMRMRFQSTGIFGRGGGMLRGAAGFAGVFGFTQMVSGAKEMNASLTDIAITGKLTGAELTNLKKMMFEVSNATGKSTTEVLSFVSAMTTATGDTKAAMVALKDIGDVSVATGTDMGALGQVFVKLTTSMKILPKEARQAFNILRGQEMVGAVTMAQMATVLPEVVGAAGIMGKSATGLKGISAIGGLMQLTRRGTGSVQEAKTSSARFLQDIYRNRKKIQKHLGVNIMDEGGNVRDLTTIFGELAVSMAKPGMLGKTLEKSIFNVRSIKSATQLAMAGKVGLGGKQGTLESFKAVFGAGGIDEIGAGKKKREASAAWQYEQQITILSNTFKKHMLPLFGQLAELLKEWGPDLIKTIKFLLENSRGLLKLWLGVKGITFFRNLMAPVGGAPGMAMAGGGLVPGGGGMMMPGGQMVPAASRAAALGVGGRAIGPYGEYMGAGGGWRGRGRPREIGGNWVSAGRSGGQFQEAGGWGAVGGATRGGLRRRIGAGIGRAGGWMAGIGRRYGGATARMGGQGLGAAGMLGMLPSWKVNPAQNAGLDMAANMGLMSGFAPAMLAGGAYKGFSAGVGYLWNRGNKRGAIALSEQVRLSQAQANFTAQQFEGSGRRLARWRTGTLAGVEQTQAVAPLLAQLGFGGAKGGEFIFNRGTLAAQGMTGVKTLRGKLGGILGTERQAAISAARREGMAPTEENLRRLSPEYARLADLMSNVEKLLAAMASGKMINVNATVIIGDTPAARLGNNSGGGGWQLNAPNSNSYGTGVVPFFVPSKT